MSRSKNQIKHLRRARKEIQHSKAANNPENDIPADLLARLGIPDQKEPELFPPGTTWPGLDETEDELECSDREEVNINPYLVADNQIAPLDSRTISDTSYESMRGLGVSLWDRMRGSSVLEKVKLPYTRGLVPSRRIHYRALANQ